MIDIDSVFACELIRVNVTDKFTISIFWIALNNTRFLLLNILNWKPESHATRSEVIIFPLCDTVLLFFLFIWVIKVWVGSALVTTTGQGRS